MTSSVRSERARGALSVIYWKTIRRLAALRGDARKMTLVRGRNGREARKKFCAPAALVAQLYVPVFGDANDANHERIDRTSYGSS